MRVAYSHLVLLVAATCVVTWVAGSTTQTMKKMTVILLLSGMMYLGHSWVSGSVVDVTVRPGDNITVYCDSTLSVGTLVTWFRNCSHVNQPSLILRLKKKYEPRLPQSELMSPLPRFQFVKNVSSNSYDLLITNITQSDEGLYFCGTETQNVGKEKYITPTYVYTYGNASTRIIFMSSNNQASDRDPKDCGVCWTLLYSLCPTIALLSSLISVLVVCLKKDKKVRVQTRQDDVTAAGPSKRHRATTATKAADEDVCYAALEIRQASHRPKKQTMDRSDFSTYSEVKNSRAKRTGNKK